MRLPVTSGHDLIKFLPRCGFEVRRQRGSHVTLARPDGRGAVVPLHKELGIKTPRNALL